MKYAIGQEVWLAHFESREKHITCDDCGGTKSLRATLFDGTEYAIECEGCQRGYLGSVGYNVVHERAACAVPAVILGMEVEGEGIVYKTNQSWYVPEADVFLTEAEALARASVIATEQNAADLDRLRSKEKPAKSWAWHVTYHRRCIREAERQLAYHESKLGIAKEKAKKQPDDVCEANARLIATAPELLEALKACRSALDSLMGDSDLPEDDSLEMQAMQAASAAIARAEGRQP